MELDSPWGPLSWDQMQQRTEFDFFANAVKEMEGRLRMADSMFEKAKQAGANEEELGHLVDEWHEADSFGEDLGAILLVAIHHWVERWRKRRLKAAGAKEKLPSDAAVLAAELAKKYDLTSLAAFVAPLETLRLFANAWKHDGDEASKQLVGNLGLDATKHYALLEDKHVREALAKRLNIHADAPCHEIVKGFLECVAAYIVALIAIPPK